MSDLTEHWPSSYADLSSDEENELKEFLLNDHQKENKHQREEFQRKNNDKVKERDDE